MRLVSILFLVVLGCICFCLTTAKKKKKRDQKIMEKLETELLKKFEEDSSFIPSLVQVTFHDCVPFCDGCLDLTNPGNRGLDNMWNFLLTMRADHAPSWSQADVNVYCGLRAAREAAIRAGGDLRLTMKIKRRTCKGNLPQRTIPFGGSTTGLQTLIDLYKLSKSQAVALLGAHTLGRCRPERTGFAGAWDRTTTELDTGYFANLFRFNWTSGPITNPNVNSHQWGINAGRVGSSPMMLNTDMALRIDFQTGANDQPSCDIRTCPEASTAEIARGFAESLPEFHREFQSALDKMVTTGQKKLKAVGLV